MKIIEIDTPQNVRIQYECADLKDRIFAYIIDMIVLGTAVGIAMLICLIISVNNDAVYTYTALAIFIFYTFFCEWIMKGRSPGKKAMSLMVIKSGGQTVTLNEVFIRWCFRIIDIYFSFGSIACILSGSSARAQRLGDIVADTVVIRTKPSRRMLLSDIMRIGSAASYVPVYPEVKKLTEADMLIIKAVLEQSKSYKNPAHDEAVRQLCDKLSDILLLKEIPDDRRNFLTTLIRDYVILTR